MAIKGFLVCVCVCGREGAAEDGRRLPTGWCGPLLCWIVDRETGLLIEDSVVFLRLFSESY